MSNLSSQEQLQQSQSQDNDTDQKVKEIIEQNIIRDDESTAKFQKELIQTFSDHNCINKEDQENKNMNREISQIQQNVLSQDFMDSPKNAPISLKPILLNENSQEDDDFKSPQPTSELQIINKNQAIKIQEQDELEKYNKTGLSLKNYEVIKMLGTGGFGQVKLVKEKGTKYERYLALKKIYIGSKMNDQKRLKVMRETQILQGLYHPSIIQMHEYFIDKEPSYNFQERQSTINWYLCILMDYAANGDLLQLIDKHKKEKQSIQETQIWIIMQEVCEGLQYLHSKNIIHRDIKPQNILITGMNKYKIADLGISKEMNSKNQALHTSKIGTPLYQAPELLRKQPYDFKVDIWALGCMMYYLACLEHPFQILKSLVPPIRNQDQNNALSHKQQLEYQILNHTPKSLPEHYSPKLQILIQRMLDKNQHTRPTALEILKLIPSSQDLQNAHNLYSACKNVPYRQAFTPNKFHPSDQQQIPSQFHMYSKTPYQSTKQMLQRVMSPKNLQNAGKSRKSLGKVFSQQIEDALIQKPQETNSMKQNKNEKEHDKQNFQKQDIEKINTQLQTSTKETEADTLNILSNVTLKTNQPGKFFNRTMYDQKLFQKNIQDKNNLLNKFSVHENDVSQKLQSQQQQDSYSNQTNDQAQSQNDTFQSQKINSQRGQSIQPKQSMNKFGLHIKDKLFHTNQKAKLSQLLQSTNKKTFKEGEEINKENSQDSNTMSKPYLQQMPQNNLISLTNQKVNQAEMPKSQQLHVQQERLMDYENQVNTYQLQNSSHKLITQFTLTNLGKLQKSIQQNEPIMQSSSKPKSQRYNQSMPSQRVYAPPIQQYSDQNTNLLEQQLQQNKPIQSEAIIQTYKTASKNFQYQNLTLANYNTQQAYVKNPSTVEIKHKISPNANGLTQSVGQEQKQNSSKIPLLALTSQKQSESNQQANIDNFLLSLQSRRESLKNPQHRTPQINSQKKDQIQQLQQQNQMVNQFGVGNVPPQRRKLSTQNNQNIIPYIQSKPYSNNNQQVLAQSTLNNNAYLNIQQNHFKQQSSVSTQPQSSNYADRLATANTIYQRAGSNSISNQNYIAQFNSLVKQVHIQSNIISSANSSASQQFSLVDNDYIDNNSSNNLKQQQQVIIQSNDQYQVTSNSNLVRAESAVQQQSQLPKIKKNIFLKSNFKNQKLTIKDLAQ